MERTVPSTASDEIELYQRTYYSLLRTTDEVQIRSLVESHARMRSALHSKADAAEIDMPALVYASTRLPSCMPDVRLVVMGPSEQVLQSNGYPRVSRWRQVFAPGRRRRVAFDGVETLVAYVASRSDIDDLVPILTAYQVEWNKVHWRLHDTPLAARLAACVEAGGVVDAALLEQMCQQLLISMEEGRQLAAVWGNAFAATLLAMSQRQKRLAVRLVSGSYVDYRKAASCWWDHIVSSFPHSLAERTVYFVSSNTHSLVNLLTTCALRQQEELIHFVMHAEDECLRGEYEAIQREKVPSNYENFLYYVHKKYTQTAAGQAAVQRCADEMRSAGIWHVKSLHYQDVDAQVIELCALQQDWLDPRMHIDGLELLRNSDALILNVDYPLGMGAYHLLSKVTTGVGELKGLYVQGKAATLNGRIGDVMIPNVVHDEQSQNTYIFHNTFCAADVRPYLIYGAALDNQKAISVRGTFLQNREYMDVFYREGFTDIEMEAGPYLSATYEAIRPKRHPTDEIIHIYPTPFEIGILHYVSDTPFTRGQTLGTQTLSYFGVDATYACSAAILKRILERELAAVKATR
ncbi:MAG: hypothetical protein JXD18_01505 [Anaerolineae bacterium]|nr:hypothetical protein [Anaerolineae bacterium]